MSTQSEIEEEIDISDAFISRLVLWNDDVNPFDKVVLMLYGILHVSLEQAEQMAMQAHTKGRADIKEGDIKELKELRDFFLNVDIKVTIE